MPASTPDSPDDDGATPARGAGASGRRAARLLAGFLAVSVGAGVLAAVLAAPVVVSTGLASNSTVAAFNALPTDLKQQPLSQQSKILYSDGSTMATFYYENRVEVPLAQVSPVMQQAIVAIEDARYWQHGGVDPRGIIRAVVNNASGDDVQGASTLTQQWIKNVQVEKVVSALPSNATTAQRQAAFRSATASSGIKGYTRKLREIKLAIAAQKKLSKKEILDNYLNITSFGDGQYGIEAASQHYFHLHAKDLPLADAALMAGVVNNPIIYDPVNNPTAALARRNLVLDRMLKQGLIDSKAHDAAKALTLAQQLSVQPISNGCAQAGGAAFFCDYAVKQFRDDDAFGGTQDERLRELYRGGLTITTTLDSAKEAAAVTTVNQAVPANASSAVGVSEPIGSALVSVEPGSGKIIAMAENRTYDTSANAPRGSTSINFSTDYQDGGSRGFQPGSTFKAFVLANWLSTGHTLNQVVNGTLRDYPASSWKMGSCGRNTASWSPHNAGDGEANSNMSVLQATYDSVNSGYAAIENQLQLCDIRTTAESMGAHKAYPDKDNPEHAVSTRLGVYPSMVLGSNEQSPLTIAAAYATFAAQGTYCTPVAITKITDADGKSLTVPASKCTQALSADVANGVTYALEQVITKGTAAGNALDGGRIAAGKTGTTNDSVAAWFTGYTPQLATSVWLGLPTISKSLNRATIAGRHYGAMYGATVSAPIWKTYMNAALAGQPNATFTDPPQTIIGAAPAPQPSPQPQKTYSGGTRSTSAPSAAPSAAPSSAAAPAPTAAPADTPAATTNP